MVPFNGSKICYLAKDGIHLLCNAVELKDGKLYKTKSGKWIPILITKEKVQIEKPEETSDSTI